MAGLGLFGFQLGEIFGGGGCFGGAEALVDGDGFAEAEDRGLRVGVCLGAGDSFKGMCLVQGAADLACQEESLLVGVKRPLRFPGAGEQGARAVQCFRFPLRVTDLREQRP